MLRAWRNDSLILDSTVISALLLLAVTVILRNPFGYGCVLSAMLIAQKTTYYYTEATVVAAVLGFLIAATAIIGTGAMTGLQMLKDQRFPLYKRLIQTFAESMFVCTVAILFSMTAVIADQDAKARPWGVLVAFGLLVLVLIRVARAGRRLYITLLL